MAFVLPVLFEDNHLIAVNKAPGEIVQRDVSGDKPLLDQVKSYLKKKYRKPGNVFLGLIHRIDRPVSGVVLFARTSKALEKMNKMFRDGQITKTYWAIVRRHPPALTGTLVHHLRRNRKQNKTYAFDEPVSESKEARMGYRILLMLDRYLLLEIDLHTGRHHQIRSQLSKVGCPVRGDLKYGYPRSNPGGGIHLHARSLAFRHPIRRESLEITADPPQDPLWDAVRSRL